MAAHDNIYNNNKLFEIVDMVKSWIPRRPEPANLSKDFWMPDQSCRVCYECDSQFTIFNRKHHCRLCGRVFCAKCTENSIPVASSDESKFIREDWERIRVCNYCFKQWEQGITTVDNAMSASSPGLSPSPSAVSLVSSTQSSCTCNSSISSTGSTMYSTGPYKYVQCSTSQSPHQCAEVDPVAVKQEQVICPAESDSIETSAHLFPNQFGYGTNRSDDEDDEFGVYRSHSEAPKGGVYCDITDYNNEIDHTYGPHEPCPHGENITSNTVNSDILPDNLSTQGIEGTKKLGEEVKVRNTRDECETPLYDEENRLLWLPPEPEEGEDEREGVSFDDDDDDGEDFQGEWGYLRSSSFGSEEHNSSNRDRSNEVHRKAMKNVVDGHFRALILQLLQVENLPVSEMDNKESWLDITTSLSWEAATLLKPDTSKGGGMDPGGYVKVKCIPCGHRSESMVVKGVVCKKNVANRRMTSKIDKPRFLILGGALEYQRVANHLSSFDTLLQQEKDHLKMAVAKIDAHHPNVLLVEKSVSRFAQEYLLAKDISLVLNIKRPLLERIARCTGAQIVPSIDHLTSQKLGYCDSFHVEKFLEEHNNAGQGGKKLTKTLMFFEGCPKPLGCTILLKGGSEDELKKVKHVVQYGVFAAYHLALETSFLADEGASLPELPLKSPITVALPDKPSSIDRSISTIPGFTIAAPPEKLQSFGEPYRSNSSISSDISSSLSIIPSSSKVEEVSQPFSPKGPTSQTLNPASPVESSVTSMFPSGYNDFSVTRENGLSSNYVSEENKECSEAKTSAAAAKISEVLGDDNVVSDCFTGALGQGVHCYHSDSNLSTANCSGNKEFPSQEQEVGSSKDEFPPSPSNHQSILVSLSTRCVWKGTVCERAHLIRIKYYGSFDMPLGRFLRDNMFDKSYRCRSCEMPSEAHVHCYTHQQGSLTISVKKLPEFVLPGEREGKIWMWHRCLRCPRVNGFPPATRRVVMSDAAWGLSFGKFLELSFSNHAAASRVANCGHSLHRDCLRFYGFGRMVACFRYASIDVHSVYLPPAKLEFNHANQEWIQKEADEVRSIADHLFSEVYNALHKISEKILPECVMTSPSSRHHIAEVERMLKREKYEFEASLQQVLNKDVDVDKPAIDILEINRLRKQLIFLSYAWDQRLIYLSSLSNSNLQEGLSIFLPKLKEKSVGSCEKPAEINTTSKAGRRFSSWDSFLLDVRSEISSNQTENCGPIRVHKGRDTHDYNLHRNETRLYHSSTINANNHVDGLDPGGTVRRVLSEGRFPMMENLSDTLDAAWTGESITPQESDCAVTLDSSSNVAEPVKSDSSGFGNSKVDQRGSEVGCSFGLPLPPKGPYIIDNSTSWLGMPFSKLYQHYSFNEVFSSKLRSTLYEYNPVYVLPFRELLRQGGARLLLPLGKTDTVVPVYDDEPTSSIAYALVSPDYQIQMSEDPERSKNGIESSVSMPLLDAANLLSLNSFTEAIASESLRSVGSTDESILLSVSGSRGSSGLDPAAALYKSVHPRVSFTDEGPPGKVKYTVTCYYAKRFEALRKTCCPSELDFIRSLSRCKKWGAQGGKSNVFFAKTLDDRFIIKQVTKTELESFIKFGPDYFKYLSESISMGSPTCLAKILGIYQVTLKHLKGGKESRMDVLVMENLLFRRNITRLYDLKGSSRSRYNPDSSGSNKVLLDQNLIEAMPTSPIFVGNKAKRLLERAVWNDTAFLASADVMDYSLLVGVDEEKHELVVGIIDFMRQYTWDKHLETWVKASGILGGPKNTSPTVISPKQYKKRFRKAMSAYFLMVPDQWSPPTIIPSRSQSDLCQQEDNNR